MSPNPVRAGEPFELLVRIRAADPEASGERIPVRLSYRITSGEETLFESPGSSIEVTNGGLTDQALRLRATSRPGDYAVEVNFGYRTKRVTETSPPQVTTLPPWFDPRPSVLRSPDSPAGAGVSYRGSGTRMSSAEEQKNLHAHVDALHKAWYPHWHTLLRQLRENARSESEGSGRVLQRLQRLYSVTVCVRFRPPALQESPAPGLTSTQGGSATCARRTRGSE